MLDNLGTGLMSQMGDAAFGPMGKHVMFTGSQYVNENVCFLFYFYIIFIL